MLNAKTRVAIAPNVCELCQAKSALSSAFKWLILRALYKKYMRNSSINSELVRYFRVAHQF